MLCVIVLLCCKSYSLPAYYKWCVHHFNAFYNSNTVRLAGGRSYNQGRVEVYYNGEWGTVCNTGWDNTAASVVCRQLGLGASGRTLYSRYYDKGSGLIFLSNVKCSINDHSLASCSHLGVGITYGCNHDDDAGVECDGKYHEMS